MNQNPLLALTELGQSIWIDHLERSRITSGDVRAHILHDGLRGMTSNPTIFEQSISGSHDYDAPIRALAQRGRSPVEIYDAITIEDIQLAADEFRGLFDGLDQRDGFVSLEVSPRLADHTQATIEEARRLWRGVDRPNVMIKVPATEAGLPAIEALIAEGISINVTLLFGLDRYAEVAGAYLSGLEARARAGLPVRIPSVASFFLSRIDVAVDAELDGRVHRGELRPELAARVRGQTAIACARIAYQRFKRIYSEPRFRALQALGARPQRLLWASTGTKDPAYGDVYYVEALIGEETIDTVPLATLLAYRDHGRPARRLEDDLDRARAVLEELEAAGIDLATVTQRLEREGVRKFATSYDRLLQTIAQRRESAQTERGRHTG